MNLRQTAVLHVESYVSLVIPRKLSVELTFIHIRNNVEMGFINTLLKIADSSEKSGFKELTFNG